MYILSLVHFVYLQVLMNNCRNACAPPLNSALSNSVSPAASPDPEFAAMREQYYSWL